MHHQASRLALRNGTALDDRISSHHALGEEAVVSEEGYACLKAEYALGDHRVTDQRCMARWYGSDGTK